MENAPQMIPLICVLGPTASGKTRYAVRLAAELDGEIISADSRQIYREMDIGTGKDLEEYRYVGDNAIYRESMIVGEDLNAQRYAGDRAMHREPMKVCDNQYEGKTEIVDSIVKEIPYHLIDIAEPGSKYNIFQYQKDFERVYKDICSRGRQPILCGGSGLYIEAVTKGYSLPEVPADPKLRAELEQYEMQYLIDMLASMKPLHNSTDYDTKKRLIRAIEIETYRQNNPVAERPFLPPQTRFIGISVTREERNSRIDGRLQERLASGMIEEVQALLDKGIPAADLIYYGLEYKFITLYIIGELTYGQMVEKLRIAIHQFAKRQMTWFRGMERRGISIEWIEP